LVRLRPQLPTEPMGARMYVAAHAAAGQPDLAEAFLVEMRDNKIPTDVLIVAYGGYADAGRPADTVRWLESSVAAEPENVRARLALADALRAMLEDGPAQWDRRAVNRCLDEYEWIRRRTPESVEIVNNMVWIQLKGVGDADTAERVAELLKRLAETGRAPAEVLDTLAAIALAKGRAREARAMLAKCLADPVRRPSYHLHMAVALAAAGEADEARAHLGRARAFALKPYELAEADRVERALAGKAAPDAERRPAPFPDPAPSPKIAPAPIPAPGPGPAPAPGPTPTPGLKP
jgi:thioredoxin-like negative regulator of GroEL